MGTATQQQQLSIPGLLAYRVRVTGMGFAVAGAVAVAFIPIARARLTSADNGFSRRTRSQFAVPVRGLGHAVYDWLYDRMVGKTRAGAGYCVRGTVGDQELCIRAWHREEACHSFIQWPSGTGRLLRMPQQ